MNLTKNKLNNNSVNNRGNNKNAKSKKKKLNNNSLNSNVFESIIKKSNPGITGILSKTSKSINKKIRNNLKKKDKQYVINQKKEKVKERFIKKYDLLLDKYFEEFITTSIEDNQEQIDDDFADSFQNLGQGIITTTYDELFEIFENFYDQRTIREYDVESRTYTNIKPGDTPLENLKLEQQYIIMEYIAERLFKRLSEYESYYFEIARDIPPETRQLDVVLEYSFNITLDIKKKNNNNNNVGDIVQAARDRWRLIQEKLLVKERFVNFYPQIVLNYLNQEGIDLTDNEKRLIYLGGYSQGKGDIDFVANLTDDELKEIFEKLYRKNIIIESAFFSKEILTYMSLEKATLEQKLEIMEHIAQRLFNKIINYADRGITAAIFFALADYEISLEERRAWLGEKGELFFRVIEAKN